MGKIMKELKTPKELWEDLKLIIQDIPRKNAIKAIDLIDEATPWTPVEPDWWLDMIDYRQELHFEMDKGAPEPKEESNG